MAKGLRLHLPAYVLLAPALLVLGAFTVLPVGDALWLSVHEVHLGTTAPPSGGSAGPVVNPNAPSVVTFFGLRNWSRLAGDPVFWQSLGNSAVFAVGTTVLGVMAALLMALLVRRPLPFMGLLRALYFVPALLSEVTAALVFLWMYDDNFGLLNRLLGVVHLGPVPWVSDPNVLMVSLILVGAWRGASYNLPIMAAGLGAVPGTLRDVARADGAGAWARLRHVVVPSMAPIMVFAVVASIVAACQALATFDVLAGDDLRTMVTVKYAYVRSFYYNDVDYGATVSLALLAVLLTAAAAGVIGRRGET